MEHTLRNNKKPLDKLFPPLLYAIVGGSGDPGFTLKKASALLEGGAKIIQLREKSLDDRPLLDLAKRLKELTVNTGALLIINDRVDIALLSQADGVHLGPEDLPLAEGRTILGANKIIGRSVRTVESARSAQRAGADYLGVGAVFATTTKESALVIGPKSLLQIADSASIPVFAIGGITIHNVDQLSFPPLMGVVVCSGISVNKPKESAQELINKLKGVDQ